MALAFSDGAANRGGVAVYLPYTGLIIKEGTAFDLSGFTAGQHYLRFGSQDNGSHMSVGYLSHVHIFVDSFIDPTQDLLPLLSCKSLHNRSCTLSKLSSHQKPSLHCLLLLLQTHPALLLLRQSDYSRFLRLSASRH